jgi:hypothetical protein
LSNPGEHVRIRKDRPEEVCDDEYDIKRCKTVYERIMHGCEERLDFTEKLA